MESIFFDKLAQFGLPGIGLFALAVAYLRKDKALDVVQEKRIAEARESIKAIQQNTDTLTTMTEIIRDRRS